MPSIKQDPLQAMLYMLFRKENSAEDALKEIREIFGEGVTTLEQVQVFYRTFVSGEYTVMELTEEERITRMNMALKAPDVQKLLMGYLDFKSRVALRQTSKVFREITTMAPLHIKELIIAYRENYVEVKTDDGYKFLLLTRQRKRYDERPKAYKERIQKFYKMVTTDLMNIFKFKSLKVKEMHFNRECHESRDLQNSFTTLRMHRAIVAAITESLRFVHGDHIRKMQVEEMCSNSLPLWNDIMPLLNPETFRTIHFATKDNRRGTTFPGTHPIMETDQWKNLIAFFSSTEIVIEESLATFMHFKFLQMPVVNAILEIDFVQLKTDLFLKPDFAHFIIGRLEFMTSDERNQLNERLETQIGVWTEFVNPNDASLKLLIRVFRDRVWFKGPCHLEFDWEDEREAELDEEDEEDWDEEE